MVKMQDTHAQIYNHSHGKKYSMKTQHRNSVVEKKIKNMKTKMQKLEYV